MSVVSLVLNSSDEKLEVTEVGVKSHVYIKNTDEEVNKYVLEIDGVSSQRSLVHFDNLLTFNGLPVFTSNNAVLEG